MGLIIAILFPAFFLLTNPYADHFFNRFLCSFCFILLLWLINSFHTGGFFAIIISLIVAVPVYFLIGATIDTSGLLLGQLDPKQPSLVKAWSFLVLRLWLLDGMVIFIRWLYDNLLEKKKIAVENELLKVAQMQAVHEALKQQISPHFLFNSLHTLSALIKQNPEGAVLFTRELSAVYRYLLVHQEKKMVPLQAELEFLQSYVYLLNIRFAGAIRTDIDIEKSCLDTMLPPNTLQLLIENAVKHNSFSSRKPLCIAVTNNAAYLIVKNNIQAKPTEMISSGTGLENIRTRYRLTAKDDIIINNDSLSFEVMLPIIRPI